MLIKLPLLPEMLYRKPLKLAQYCRLPHNGQ
nr:MAG TPA: hypothetical protein [Caudoviricetes sp.]